MPAGKQQYRIQAKGTENDQIANHCIAMYHCDPTCKSNQSTHYHGTVAADSVVSKTKQTRQYG